MYSYDRSPTYQIPANPAPTSKITKRVKIIWLSRERDADAEASLTRLINDNWVIISSGSAGDYGFIVLQTMS